MSAPLCCRRPMVRERGVIMEPCFNPRGMAIVYVSRPGSFWVCYLCGETFEGSRLPVYEPPTGDEPLDAVEQAFVRMFASVIVAELRAESASSLGESAKLASTRRRGAKSGGKVGRERTAKIVKQRGKT